jgi:hypothetical protein
VRRDEAEAHAREEDQDRRTQTIDSERRLSLLRGRQVGDLPAEDGSPPAISRKSDPGYSRKRRRLGGEDDTDLDMRLAKEGATLQSRASTALRTPDDPLIDSQGHINLVPSKSKRNEKNFEAEAERAAKKREYEDQYTMRFSNAAGFKHGLSAPWYSTISKDDTKEVSGKDVWGNEDAGRREREKIRSNLNDPLAEMKRGVKQLRDVERSRKDWRAERKRELRELESLEKSRHPRRQSRKRHRGRIDSNSPDGFSLDNASSNHKEEGRHHRPRSGGHHSGSRIARPHDAYTGETASQ